MKIEDFDKEIIESPWTMKVEQTRALGENATPVTLRKSTIFTVGGRRIQTVDIAYSDELLAFTDEQKGILEARIAQNIVNSHNAALGHAIKEVPLVDNPVVKVETKKPEVQKGKLGYWWTDGTTDIKAKEAPGPNFRRGRSGAFKKKDKDHGKEEGAVQAQSDGSGASAVRPFSAEEGQAKESVQPQVEAQGSGLWR